MNKIDLIVCEKKENEGLPSCVYLTCFKPEQTSGHSNSTGVKYIQANVGPRDERSSELRVSMVYNLSVQTEDGWTTVIFRRQPSGEQS